MLTRKIVFWCLFLFLIVMLPTGWLAAQSAAPFRVYLTFEDGPTDTYTPELLDILAQHNAKATFFVNGWQIAGREAILQRMIREGHAIGNHLWRELGYYAGAPDDKVIAAYQETEAAIRTALGAELAIYEAQVKLFRQPGGGGHALILPEGEPVITYNWQVDGDDCGWKLGDHADLNNFDQIVIDNILNEPTIPNHVYNAYDYGDGVVIVLHDVNRVTGRVLPVILSELQQAGATFHALPRPEDATGTMPVLLGVPPAESAGIPGVTLPALVQANAYLREKPFVGARILELNLAQGTSLTAIGRVSGWVQVIADDKTGWVSADLLKIFGPIPSLPLISS